MCTGDHLSKPDSNSEEYSSQFEMLANEDCNCSVIVSKSVCNSASFHLRLLRLLSVGCIGKAKNVASVDCLECLSKFTKIAKTSLTTFSLIEDLASWAKGGIIL